MSGEEYDEDEFDEVGSDAVEEEDEEEEEGGGGGGDVGEEEGAGGESQEEGADEEGEGSESDAAPKGNGDDDDPAEKRAESPGDDGEQVDEPGHASQGLPPSQSQPTARPGGEVRKSAGGLGATWLAQTEKNDAISAVGPSRPLLLTSFLSFLTFRLFPIPHISQCLVHSCAWQKYAMAFASPSSPSPSSHAAASTNQKH